MLLLIIFAFIAGVVTILSPCILPLLPIILSSSDSTGKQKPFGVVVGFILSFTFFTLFLSTIVKLTGVPANSLRFLSIVILTVFGVSLLVPKIQLTIELLFSRLARLIPSSQKHKGFFGGIFIGLSLGLLWTPCVGPILASVISLAITGTVTAQTLIITFSYALGTGLPMLLIMLAGSTALQKLPWLVKNTQKIQKGFGILMIATALAIYGNVDRSFQRFILETFPNYGTGLTRFEDQSSINKRLNELQENAQDMFSSQKNEVRNQAPELIAGGEWFNSPPLTLQELRDKVVLLDFWTYSCINCQRSLPYIQSWWEKYKESGLVIIGIHSPEFEFEKDPQNVKAAIADFALTYPVMQDNNFATWRAYANQYWPAKYLIDKNGQVRYTHFGEGKYNETEKIIQQLLLETGSNIPTTKIDNKEYAVFSRTPELYLGYSRIEHLASPEKISKNQETSYTAPSSLPNHAFAYEGKWTITPEYAAPNAGSKLILNYESQKVFLVARPRGGKTEEMIIHLDGVKQFLGADNQNGVVQVTSDKLYELIDAPQPGRHQLEIEFPEGNVEVYAFTFG